MKSLTAVKCESSNLDVVVSKKMSWERITVLPSAPCESPAWLSWRHLSAHLFGCSRFSLAFSDKIFFCFYCLYGVSDITVTQGVMRERLTARQVALMLVCEVLPKYFHLQERVWGRQPKLYSPVTGQPDGLCQWQWCLSTLLFFHKCFFKGDLKKNQL